MNNDRGPKIVGLQNILHARRATGFGRHFRGVANCAFFICAFANCADPNAPHIQYIMSCHLK
uniref:Uncharacterized protein n=1 Tax=Romanomermis culicivorax TaxID=13658 RepID=A0A915L300_ROMCU